MKIPVVITILAGAEEVETYPLVIRSPDARAWEKANNASWFGSENSFVQNADLAFYAARRVGKWTGTLEEWDRVADVDDSETVAENPTIPPEAGEKPSSD
jgi:hypothetical protein